MKIEGRRPFPDTAASAQAAEWFARQRVAPLSGADAAAFEKWLKAEPAHMHAWSEYRQLWGRIEAIRDDPKILAIREEASRSAERRARARHGGRLVAALTAGIGLGLAVWWNPQKHGLEYGDSLTRSAHAPAGPDSSLIREASTRIGERSILIMADGSKVTLNTATAVHADFTGRERRLTLLRGEAFFDVAKDPTRPFIVTAGTREVVAVGTAFDVRLQDRQIKVTLVEGKVRVVPMPSPTSESALAMAAPAAVTLEAGSALVADANGSEHVEQLDTDRATSWRSGKLVFDGERLADVVAEMNRYSTEKLEISGPALESRKVSGVFEPTEAHAFAAALQAYGIVRANQKNVTTIELDPP